MLFTSFKVILVYIQSFLKLCPITQEQKKEKKEWGQEIIAKGFFEKLNDMKGAKPKPKKSKPKSDKD